MTSPAGAPPPTATIREAARVTAVSIVAGSTPRSNLWLASVDMPRARRVARTWRGSKRAHSSRMSTESPVTSESRPPITPATATGRFASRIMSISGVSGRFSPSSVTSDSPGRARPTVIVPPASPARSKAWSGCPSSSMT